MHEKRDDVGGRFHGDFQGLENWTTETDVLDELEGIGIEPEFDCHPVSEFICFDPKGRELVLQSSMPLFYLVRRGPIHGSLDQGLKRAAIGAGAQIHFESRRHHLRDAGIVAEGPHSADVIASGYVFQTDMADGCFAVLGERLAPQGYAYLLVHGGRGTVATCMYGGFHNERKYVERTVAFFRDRAGLRWTSARRFGGSGHFSLPETAQRGALFYAGESAGFQDALFGFGLRYSIVSGSLAARAIVSDGRQRYDELWQRRLGGQLRASMANRWLYRRLGDSGRGFVLGAVLKGKDAREFMRRLYEPRWFNNWIRSSRFRSRLARAERVREACDCTWCRGQRTSKGSRSSTKPSP